MFKRFKEIYNSKKWEKFADKPCDMFKMEIEGRIASKGINYRQLSDAINFLISKKS
jgi:hypothetical protein